MSDLSVYGYPFDDIAITDDPDFAHLWSLPALSQTDDMDADLVFIDDDDIDDWEGLSDPYEDVEDFLI